MKTKTPFFASLSHVHLRAAAARELAPRSAPGRRVRSFVLHTLPLRSQRSAVPYIRLAD